jgi:hypothetical protein
MTLLLAVPDSRNKHEFAILPSTGDVALTVFNAFSAFHLVTPDGTGSSLKFIIITSVWGRVDMVAEKAEAESMSSGDEDDDTVV